MAIYVTSDTHFNHSKILQYCNRPFQDVIEMNNTIINNWNNIITNNDTVVHFGDFGFGNFEEMKMIFDSLNGLNKHLIMGNHDKRHSVKWWKRIGFDQVFNKYVLYKNYYLSHRHKETNRKNIHGHIHNNICKFKNCYNVCLEVNDYKPILLNNIIGEME